MLRSGSRLAHYEIVSAIGKGGMGEVWRARDTKLGREVAIKTLPSEFAEDPDRLARFRREAKLLAALNHPNIAAIYGLEEHEGLRFLVLELVEGDTLADRLERGALPVEESLSLALQIAEALEAAHEKGVIHRDLKPANIKVTPDGRIKVLDFGLAKAVVGDQAEVDLSNSPTLSVAATGAGLILGTAGYMSPEQARGRPVDHRADVWAFGVVLFEMLTGRPPFEGPTVSDILARVLAKDPPWESLPHSLHPRLLQLLERCMAKDPKDRYAGIADARVDVVALLADPGRGTIPPAVDQAPTRSRVGTVLWVSAAVILGAFLTWFFRPLPEAAPGIVMRFPIALPPDQVLTQLAVGGIAISPDGTKFAYVANNQIYMREMRDPVARPLAGTAGTDISTPVFSPDGESIAFYELRTVEDTTLKRVPIAGGTAVPLWQGPAPLSVSWPTDDTILFTTITADSILEIPAHGGDAQVLIAARDGELLESPQLLPDGKHILFTSSGTRAWDTATIYIQAIDGDERTLVWTGGSDAQWVRTGHIIYANGNDLFAIPWDLDRMEPAGRVVSVLHGVQRSSNSDAAQVAVSDNGTLVYVPEGNAAIAPGETRRSSLVWVDPDDGSERPIRIPAADFRMARLSPDQRRVALVVGSPGDIWVYNLETGTGGQRTFDAEADETDPLWVSDDELLFASSSSDQPGIYSMPAGGGEATIVASAGGDLGTLPSSLSPDGHILLAENPVSDTASNVVVLDLTNPTGFRSLIEGYSSIAEPALAPNGQWVAVVESPPGGRPTRIELHPFPDVDRTVVLIPGLRGEQRQPLFLGDRLLFLIPDQGIYSVDVTFEPEFAMGQRVEPVVSGRFWYTTDGSRRGRAWDVHPDGRLLMIRLDELVASDEDEVPVLRDQINVVSNWFEELRGLAPVP